MVYAISHIVDIDGGTFTTWTVETIFTVNILLFIITYRGRRNLRQWNHSPILHLLEWYFAYWQLKKFMRQQKQIKSYSKDDYASNMRSRTISRSTNLYRSSMTLQRDRFVWCNVHAMSTAGLSTITRTQLPVSCCRLLAVWLQKTNMAISMCTSPTATW